MTTFSLFGQGNPTINYNRNSTIYVGDTVTFINTSLGFPLNQEFVWNTGECQSDTTQPISHCNDTIYGTIDFKRIYWVPGYYIVKLKAQLNGSTFEKTDTLFVNPKTQALSSSCDCNNIIINPGFEDNNFCPNLNYPNGIHPAFANGALSNWYQPPMTVPLTLPDPNYFLTNSCIPGNGLSSPAWVPCNPCGYQQGFNGSNAYIGLVTYNNNTTYREYAEEQIQCALLPGEYEISMQVSLPENVKYANNNIGAYLSIGSLPPANTTFNLPYTPQFLNSSTITVRNAWTNISGIIIAIGNEDHITIGNFNNNVTTNGVFVNNISTNGCTYQGYQNLPFTSGYYYIDEVKLKPHIPQQITVSNSSCSAILTAQGGTAYTYLWTTGATTNSIFVNSSGTYTVTVTHATGCTATVSAVVALPNILNVSFTGSHAKCIAGNYTVNSSYAYPVTYSWFYQLSSSATLTPYGGSLATQNFPSALFASASGNVNLYAVVTNNTTGCTASSSLTLYPCCSSSTPNYNITNTTSSAVTTAIGSNIMSTSVGQTIAINGTFTINNNFTFNHANVTLGPDARIVVQGNNELHILDGSHLHSCNGDYMWDGIYVGVAGTANQGLVENRALIEDALNSIVSTNGGRLKLIGATFNKNFKHVIIKDYAGSSTFCDITNSSFKCNTIAGAPDVLIKPYLNFKSYVGIEITNVTFVKFGDNSLTGLGQPLPMQIFFKNLDYGIKTQNSSIEVYLCSFENINLVNSYNPIRTCGTAIFAEGRAKNPSPYYYTTIGSKNYYLLTMDYYTYPNEFIDCKNGINLNNNMAGTIAYNTFSNLVNTNYAAIDISLSNASDRDYYVHDNILSNFSTGIIGSNLYSMTSLRIEKNILTGATSPFTTIYGICFNNASLNKNKLYLFNNTITDCRIGTYASNVDGLVMDGKITEKNMITFAAPPTTTNNHYGVWLQYCPNARINYAEINKTSSGAASGLTSMQGITIENSNAAIINQCKLVNMGSGIRIKNSSISTELHCNKMDNCLRGVNLESANLGAKPIQGVLATNTPWDNQWVNMPILGNRVKGTISSSSPTINPIKWLHKSGVGSQPYYPGNLPNVITPQGNQTGINYCVPLLAADENQYKEEGVDGVVDDSTGSSQTDEEQYYQDEYAFDNLANDSTFFNPADSAYQLRLQYYNAQAQTAIGKFYRVKLLIDSGAVDSALTYLNTITTANAVELNIFTTLHIYLTTYAMGLEPDSVQITTLQNIAALHVMSGGPGVYNARAMLGWEQDDAGVALRSGFSFEQNANTENAHPNFYPNPTKNIISLDYFILSNELITVCILDVYGRILNQRDFKEDELISVDLTPINNGTYLIKLKRNGVDWFANKIIVIK